MFTYSLQYIRINQCIIIAANRYQVQRNPIANKKKRFASNDLHWATFSALMKNYTSSVFETLTNHYIFSHSFIDNKNEK